MCCINDRVRFINFQNFYVVSVDCCNVENGSRQLSLLNVKFQGRALIEGKLGEMKLGEVKLWIILGQINDGINIVTLWE